MTTAAALRVTPLFFTPIGSFKRMRRSLSVVVHLFPTYYGAIIGCVTMHLLYFAYPKRRTRGNARHLDGRFELRLTGSNVFAPYGPAVDTDGPKPG